MNRKSVLVTGSSGKIGMLLVHKLLKSGWHVYGLSSKNSVGLHARHTHLQIDWASRNHAPLPQVDVIYHLASQTSSYIARQDIARDVNENLILTCKILKEVSKFDKAPLFVYPSSTTVYGFRNDLIINEHSKVDPQTFYDTSKLAAEMYINQSVIEKWISAAYIFRLSNVYGSANTLYSNDRGFVDSAIKKSLKTLDLTCYGTGKYTRDYIHITDVVEAFIKVSECTGNFNSEIFNLGTGIGTTIYDTLVVITEEVSRAIGHNSKIKRLPFPIDSYDIEKRNAIVPPTKFIEFSGWQPKVNLRDGIRAAINVELSKKGSDT